MMICTFYTTYRTGDGDLIPADLEATGDSLDDLIPDISDEVATELALADEFGRTVEIADNEGNEIGRCRRSRQWSHLHRAETHPIYG